MTLQISLEELIQSGAHFGHQSRRWNPKMSQYIYGVKDGIQIFELIKTKEKLAEALDSIRQYSKEGTTIVFVATKKTKYSMREEYRKGNFKEYIKTILEKTFISIYFKF